jgi:hypothetical protein
MSRARHRLTALRNANIEGTKTFGDHVPTEKGIIVNLWPTACTRLSNFPQELFFGFKSETEGKILDYQVAPILGSSNTRLFPEYIPYLHGGGLSGDGLDYSWYDGASWFETMQCWTDPPGGAGKFWNVQNEFDDEDDVETFYISLVDNNGYDLTEFFEDYYNDPYPLNGKRLSIRVFYGDDWVTWHQCYIDSLCLNPSGGDEGFAKIKTSSQQDDHFTKSDPSLTFVADRSNNDIVKIRIALDVTGHGVVCETPDDGIAFSYAGDLDVLSGDGTPNAGMSSGQSMQTPSMASHTILYWNFHNDQVGNQHTPGITWSAAGYCGDADSSNIISAKLHMYAKPDNYYGLEMPIDGLAPPRSVGRGNIKPYWNDSESGSYTYNGRNNGAGSEIRYYDANFFVRGVKQAGLTWDGCLGVTSSNQDAPPFNTICNRYNGFWRPNWNQVCGHSSDGASAGATWAMPGGIDQVEDMTSLSEGNADFNVFTINDLTPPSYGEYSLENPNNQGFYTLDVTDIVRQQHDQNGGGYISIIMGLCGDHLCHGQSYDHPDWIKSKAGAFIFTGVGGQQFATRTHLELTYNGYFY